MSETIKLDISSAALRARYSVIRTILASYNIRELNTDQAVRAINNLIEVELTLTNDPSPPA